MDWLHSGHFCVNFHLLNIFALLDLRCHLFCIPFSKLLFQELESTFVIEEEKKRYLLCLRDLIAGNYEDTNEARVVEQSDSNEANPVEVPELVDFEESVIVLEDGEDEL